MTLLSIWLDRRDISSISVRHQKQVSSKFLNKSLVFDVVQLASDLRLL